MYAILAGISTFVANQAVIHPWIATVILVLTVVRAINKPLFTFLHTIVLQTVSTKDDEVLVQVETSKAYLYFCYFLDYVFSIKIGTQKESAAATATVVEKVTP